MRVGAIVQARMTSARLPGKVLMDLPAGSKVPMLAHVVRRLKCCKQIDEVIIATTTNATDDRVASLAECLCFRGSEHDVLSRYHDAAVRFGLDVIVRVTADCPFIDPAIVDAAIQKHLDAPSHCHYTSNTMERTFARGMDVEVFSMEALATANAKALQASMREHVTPFIQLHPDPFMPQQLHAKDVYGHDKFTRPDLRLTVDTMEDYLLAHAVFAELYPANPFFSYPDIVGLLDRKPGLAAINANVVQKITKGENEI